MRSASSSSSFSGTPRSQPAVAAISPEKPTRSRWAHLPGHLRAWIESAPVAGLPSPSPPLEDAVRWPPADGRRVVFLLDASSGLERRFLEQWIVRARPSGVTPAGYDVVAIPP